MEPMENFREEMVVTASGIQTSTSGPCSSRTMSRCLDWIHESIASVRMELGI